MKLAGKGVRAFVWDTPLLAETGLDRECDALVFVCVPANLRLARVREIRGWTRPEWLRREKLQWPLDKKRKMAKYMVRNTAGADEVRNQVRLVLSRIVAE
jgi:dephospho-CoA kinase